MRSATWSSQPMQPHWNTLPLGQPAVHWYLSGWINLSGALMGLQTDEGAFLAVSFLETWLQSRLEQPTAATYRIHPLWKAVLFR